jgi:hypothetical protein
MSMIEHQIRRREELQRGYPPATPVPTGGKGSRGNTGHLNLDKPLLTAPTGSKKMANYRARVAALAALRAKRKIIVAKRKPISEHRMALLQHRARVYAYISELASLGRFPCEIATLLKLSEGTIYRRMRQAGIKAPGRESHLRQMVRQWYGIKSPREIAEIVGTTPKTVGVVAHVLGVTGRVDPAKFRRGFTVPDDRWDEYIAYRRELHGSMSAVDTAIMMGLLPRPPLEPRPIARYAGQEIEAPRP